MSLYVYAIADGAFELDDLRGVAGEPLQFVASGDGRSHAIAGDLTADVAAASASAGVDASGSANASASASGGVSGTVDANQPALSAETLHAQDALVRQLAARAGALLPARFGARFADAPTVRQTLDDLATRLDRALTRVRGREQMTLRIFQDRAPSAPSDNAGSGLELELGQQHGPGTRYMRQRAAAGRRWPPAIEDLRAALRDAIDDERVERGQPPVIGSIHHLIPRGSADRYLARLEAAAASVDASGIRLRVSGPSPAYAFAEADLS